MSTLRVKKKEKYFVLENALAQDSRLTFAARGLMAYLLSKPDDWRVRMADLEAQSPAKMKAIRSLVRELIECGYIERRRIHRAGRLDWEYLVHEEAQQIQSTPCVSIEKQHIHDVPIRDVSIHQGEIYKVLNKQSTNLQSTEETKLSFAKAQESTRDVDFRAVADSEPTKASSTQQQKPQPVATATPPKVAAAKSTKPKAALQHIEEIYQLYPRHCAKGEALPEIQKALDRIANASDRINSGLDEEVWSLETARAFLLEKVRQYREATNQWPEDERKFIPHPMRWFRRKRYLDDPLEWRRNGVNADGINQSNRQPNNGRNYETAAERRARGWEEWGTDILDKSAGLSGTATR